MKLTLFGDLEGKVEITRQILHSSPNSDAVIFTGDIPNPEVFKYLRQNKLARGIDKIKDVKKELIDDTLPEKALKQATQEVVRINKILKPLQSKFYGVLGNADLHHYEKFTSWPFHLLHNRITRLREFYLIGYDGRPFYSFEKDNPNEPTFSESQIYRDLSKLLSQVNPSRTILVTHVPPYGILDKVDSQMVSYAQSTYGEKAKKGNIGSLGLRRVVLEYKPYLHVFGHVHESQGVYLTSSTIFVNLGSAGETHQICSINLKPHHFQLNFTLLTK